MKTETETRKFQQNSSPRPCTKKAELETSLYENPSKLRKLIAARHELRDVLRKTRRRSKIVRRATGRYAVTSFDQLLVCLGPRLWAWHIFFLSPKAIPRFRPFILVRPTQVFHVFENKKKL